MLESRERLMFFLLIFQVNVAVLAVVSQVNTNEAPGAALQVSYVVQLPIEAL